MVPVVMSVQKHETTSIPVTAVGQNEGSMSGFPNFFGNSQVTQTLRQMLDTGRLSQTLLLAGPEGVGKRL